MKTPAVLLVLISLLASPARSTPLSLEAYLEQVKNQSPGVQSSQKQISGSQETSKEGQLPYSPRFFLNTTHIIDHREFPNAFFGGRTTSDNFNLGFEKQFNFGLSAKLSYTLFNNSTSNLPPLIFPNGINAYSSGQTQLDLSQSLWRNFFGKETRASEELAEASSLANHYGERFKLKQTLAQAESAYYRVAIAHESVKLEDELFDRSKKILDWTQRRVNNHLADRVDLLQAKANHQNRIISRQTALEEQRAAHLAFNQFRNSNSDELQESIPLSGAETILAMKTPERNEESDDIRASKESERIARASNELAIQKTEPDLTVFGTAAFNGVDRYLSPALASSFTTQNPYYVLGLKFSYPLNFLDTSEIRSGRVKQQLAAESNTRQKILESEQNWNDLTHKLTEAQTRLKMALELSALQKDKLEYEKYRFNLGRTTTYQVLMFEQDYAQAMISKLRVEREILSIQAQLKTLARE